MFGSNRKKKDDGRARLGTSDKLFALGGLLRDAGTGGNSNHFGAAMGANQNKLAQMQQAHQQKQKQNRAVAMAGNDPQMQKMALADPDAFMAGMIKRNTGHNTVNGGDSVVTYGPDGRPQMAQAQENFQHGNLIGTVGNGQGSTYNMGASNADLNATMGHNVTAQGNKLDFAKAKMEDGTKRYVSDNSLTGTKYTADGRLAGDKLGFQADMAQTGVNQQEADTARYAALNPKAQSQYSDSEIKNFRDTSRKLGMVEGTMKNYQDMLNENGKLSNPLLNRGKRSEMEAAYTAATLDAKELFELGALSGPDLDLIQQLLPSPTGLGTDKNAQAKMEQVMSYLTRAKNSLPEEFRPQSGGNVPLSTPQQGDIEAEMRRRGLL